MDGTGLGPLQTGGPLQTQVRGLPISERLPEAAGRLDLEIAGFTVNLSLPYLHEAFWGSKKNALWEEQDVSLIPEFES